MGACLKLKIQNFTNVHIAQVLHGEVSVTVMTQPDIAGGPMRRISEIANAGLSCLELEHPEPLIEACLACCMERGLHTFDEAAFCAVICVSATSIEFYSQHMAMLTLRGSASPLGAGLGRSGL